MTRVHRAGQVFLRGAALVVALLATGIGAAAAQITVDASSSANVSAGSLTWAHTVGSGSNRFLIVGVSIRNANSQVSGITYAGAALTFIGAQNNSDNAVRTEMWYRAAPTVGTANVVVTLTSAAKMVGGAVSFFGVNPSSPQNAAVTANSTGTGTTDPSVTIGSATNEMIVTATSTEGSAGTVTPTNQTQQWNNFYGTSGGDAAGFGGTVAGAASVTLGWHKTGTAKWAIIAVALQPAVTTTLGNGTDPSNASLGPGGAATMADAFTLQTSSGTDAVTAVTVTLATGTSGGLSLVEITNDAGTVVYGSASNPASDTPAITLSTNITATTTSTQYRIRVTPKSHANMPAPPGSSYAVTARISAWTSSNTQAGSDAAGTTVTIDNLSPGDVTAATATGAIASVLLDWTNPGDADLSTIIVLRRTTSAVTDAPTEGATYSVGNTIGSSTVACVVTAPASSCTDTGLSNGTAYYYKIFTRDANGNYSTGTVPSGSPATPGQQTMSSAANQSFVVGASSTTASTITVTDLAGKYKPGSDVYFVIPATLSMIWDNTIGSVTITGNASAKVSSTPTYTSSTCAKITVLSNFNPNDQIIVAGLALKSFTATGGPDNLNLGLKSCTAIVASDDKTKTIVAAATTLATGTDPGNATIGPGGAATMADAFTFQTNSGTDAITAVTVTLAAGTSGGLSLVEITNDAGTVVYGSASNPGSDTPAITLTTNITATTTATQYKIRVTPKSHAAMPAPPGSSYSLTASISNWTGTNGHSGSDAGGTTVTIDNLSPGNVTSSTATSGNTQVSLAWTNPGDADLSTIIVLRRAGTAVGDTPTEGATYSVGNTIGSSTVACVVSAPTASCTDTGLSNGTAYHYKIFTKDANGNYSTGAVPTGSPVTPNVTTLATGTDPSNASLGPGGAATMADAFTFQTASGTDAITAVTVTLAAGTSAGLSLVEITDNAGSTVYGSVSNPGSDTPAISLTTNITATTTATQYKIRVTPRSHAAMPVPPGSTYSVTARITAWTGTYAQAGSDAAGTTVTIDNLSPGNVTASTATAGVSQVALAWTNPADADLASIIVLRRAGSAVGDTPTEGATYSAGNTIGSSTVACVVSAPTASCTDAGLTGGTAYHYKIFTQDANGNYATGVVPTGSPATPSTPPAVNITNSASPNGTQPPGTDLAYTLSFSNTGGAPATSLVVVDSLKTNVDFKVGSVTSNLGTTGLTVVVAYSNNGGSTFAYTPVSGGGGAPAGYDRSVTHVRWTFTGNLSQTSPNNAASVGLTARIR
jgi:hypothetical protein